MAGVHGEATLVDKLFESGDIEEVIAQAIGLGLKFKELRMGRVRYNGQPDTLLSANLYLESKKGNDHLITRSLEAGIYALYKYK